MTAKPCKLNVTSVNSVCINMCCICVSMHVRVSDSVCVLPLTVADGYQTYAEGLPGAWSRPSIWKQFGSITSAIYATLFSFFFPPPTFPLAHIQSGLTHAHIFTEHAHFFLPLLLLYVLLLLHTLISATHSLDSLPARKLRQQSIPHFSTRHLGWLTPNSISCPLFFFPMENSCPYITLQSGSLLVLLFLSV